MVKKFYKRNLCLVTSNQQMKIIKKIEHAYILNQ